MTEPAPPAADAVPSSTLAEELARHAIVLKPEQIEQLDRYRALLWEWNEKLNLTRHTTLEKFVTRDVLDSQQLAAQLAEGETLLDIGSGGGVPGIIVSILRPDVKVEMCESVGKRAQVLATLVKDTGLNVPVHHRRAEELLLDRTYTSVCARAVASIDRLLLWLDPHWKHAGRLLLIKGPSWVEERGEARHSGRMKGIALRKLGEYKTPVIDAYNVLLQLSPGKETG